METLKSPLEKAVAAHRKRLDLIVANATGPRPGLNEQLREASAELLSAEIQKLLEPFYGEQLAAAATDPGKVKALSEAHLGFVKLAHAIVHEEAILDGVTAGAISAAKQAFAATFGASPSSPSSKAV